MATNSSKKDIITAVRFYIDKIVSDPSIGGGCVGNCVSHIHHETKRLNF